MHYIYIDAALDKNTGGGPVGGIKQLLEGAASVNKDFLNSFNIKILAHDTEGDLKSSYAFKKYLEKNNFENNLNFLTNKYKNKKIIIYGASIIFSHIVKNYDLSGLNIIGIADKKVQNSDNELFGYKAVTLEHLENNNEADVILIAALYTESIKNYLLNRVFSKSKNKPVINSLINPSKTTFDNFFPKQKEINRQIQDLFFFHQTELQNISEEIEQKLDINNIKSFHAHSTLSFVKMFNYLQNNKKENVVKILTSHCPEAPHLESAFYNFNLKNLPQTQREKFKELYKKIDTMAFEKADVIIFPCKEAIEPYYETWSEFKDIIKDKDVRFVATGCNALSAVKSRKGFLEDKKVCDIPKDAFIASYVGRHFPVKGYDTLQEAAKIVWQKNPDVYFVIAGSTEGISPLNDTRWKEMGFYDDLGSLIKASDVFILPNKRTYFDMVLLEIISLGQPVIASYTGGNKTIMRLTDGVISFEKDNPQNLADKILEFSQMPSEKIKNLGLNNQKAFDENFTSRHFASKYFEVLESIRHDYNLYSVPK